MTAPAASESGSASRPAPDEGQPDPPAPDASTRERLTAAAAALFRRQGYHATGLSEVLAAAGAPKGSLYHHFPNGKADLARAAAGWTADRVVEIIDASFAAAPDFRHGATTLCHKLAKLFDLTEGAGVCPIAGLLFDGPEDQGFRDTAAALYDRFAAAVAGHAARLHHPDPAGAAETLLVAVDGGWTMARARRSSDILRRLPARLWP